uniref:Serine protease n=1 Tax=Pundamilia nyererei TaxID=303518 RepID=A0A3B4GML2_9CICH
MHKMQHKNSRAWFYSQVKRARRWSYRKNIYTYTCNQAQTIEDCLKKNPKFKAAAEKQDGKELVIVRSGKAITSHFPCRVIKNERLTLKFVKAVEKPKKPVSVSGYPCKKRQSNKLVIFHVIARGGKNVVRILKNPDLRKDLQEITVYAYEGEKVKQALRRDGRFLNTIESLAGHSGGYEELSQQTNAVESETDNVAEKKPNLCGNIYLKRMQNCLSSEFKDSIKSSKKQAHDLNFTQNLLRLEFGSNAQSCREVKTMRKIMELSHSVCQVRINGKPQGSGFLVFSRFVLTSAHVVKDFCNDNGRLHERVTVTFSYESLEQNDGLIDVEEVSGYDYSPDVSGTDWALLKLSDVQILPGGLLTHCGFIRHSGGISIVGHPDGGTKKIESCLVVSSENRNRVVERHYSNNKEPVQFVTRRFFEKVAVDLKQRKHLLTYESCLYFGSSGSPVFNKDSYVVAMHPGGYAYPGVMGQNQSVIEFGYPFSDIIEHIIIQMVEREKFNVSHFDVTFTQ